MAENCSHDCSSCGENCSSRDKKSLLKKPHQMSDIKKVIAVVSGKGGVGKSMTCALLAAAAQNSGKVMTYSTVMNNVWGPYSESDNKILRVNMANIRRKLEKNPAEPVYIFTEVGVGYRMADDEEIQPF